MFTPITLCVIICLFPVIQCTDPLDPTPGQGWELLSELEPPDPDQYEAELCSTLRCRKGEECVLRGRVAMCQCKRTCPHDDRPICGSDGITYASHCHLHQQSCVSGIRLHMIKHGHCDQEATPRPIPFNNMSLDNTTAYGSSTESSTPETTTQTFTTNSQLSIITDEMISTTAAIFTTNEQSSTQATTIADIEPDFCSSEDFAYVPSNLLLYFHAKYADPTSSAPSERGKSYLVHLMFNHFDLNADRILSKDEFQRLDEEGKYKKLMPIGCHLMDLLSHADNDGDGRLNESEFFRIFDLPVAFISPHNEIKIHNVEIGQQYQLFCDIEKYNSASLKVTWYRYDVPLVNVAPYDFEVSADGSLYLTPVSLTHNGNFTCRVPISGLGSSAASDLSSNSLQQVHVVNVFKRARITVTPDFLLLKTGENGYLQCRVDGYPVARVNWEKNGRLYRENVSVLQLANVRTYDTGSYGCAISARPGMDRNEEKNDFLHRTASVVVRDGYDQPEMAVRFNTRHQPNAFFAMFETGIRQFRADDCVLMHAIPSTYPNSEEKQGFLCRDKKCHWSDAVVTQPSTYLYATLSEQMALVKINVTSGSVEQYFHLNHVPKQLRYIDWEDSIWVESWHAADGNYRTVQVIRSASKSIRHTLTHALPLRDEFDAVHRVFLPKSGRLKYGYVTHARERALHKIDLHSLKIVSRVSLVPYDCQPSEVAFVAQVGLAVVQCSPSTTGNRTSNGGQLILDYISDATLGYDADVHGIPVATDDGQWIINVDTVLGRIFVHRVDGKGGPLVATIDEFLPINDWALHPSITYGSWDLYAAPLNGIHLIKINIPDAKMQRITVTNDEKSRKPITLVSTYKQNRYLVGATSESVFSMDLFESNAIKCQVNLNGTQKIVWAV